VRKKVVVKRLNAIQNFGAMEVLCTDKIDTLMQGRIILKRLRSVNLVALISPHLCLHSGMYRR